LKITKFITGVGGVAINENRWKLSNPTNNTIEKKTYQFDGFIYQGRVSKCDAYLKATINLDRVDT
jgi:hypothetical protein